MNETKGLQRRKKAKTRRGSAERLKGLVGSAVEVVSCMQKKKTKKKHGRVRLW